MKLEKYFDIISNETAFVSSPIDAFVVIRNKCLYLKKDIPCFRNIFKCREKRPT